MHVAGHEEVSVTQLTPLLFLERSAQVFPDKIGFVHGDRTLSYQEMAAEAQMLGSALLASGVQAGDRVAYLSPNTPEMLLGHFGVPLIGAVLVAINTRLSSAEVEYILGHAGASMLVMDAALTDTVAGIAMPTVREVVVVDRDVSSDIEAIRYDEFLQRGASAEPIPWRVDDELRAISINYTSGTTGRPKGVQYSHRGAHLNALAEIIHSRHSPDSVYLWTLPMFHCNGWCTTWGVTAIGGTHVGLRAAEAGAIWTAIRTHGVTHMNAAPTVLISMVNHSDQGPIDHTFTVTTAGAPPSPTIIEEMESLGADIVHVYGLTETYGPYTVCEIQSAWQGDPQRVKFLARQGVAYIGADPIRVVDENMIDVRRDGATMGEVVMAGNNVMTGYYGDPEATAEAFRGGWFHSGDVAVWHADGYIELRDRSKDVIISGGENISTIEVEQAVMSHPAVLEAAVVSVPHDHWGERPKAFVVMKPSEETTEAEIIAHVQGQLAKFKAPDTVDFLEALPKTSTGKIQKYVLRDQEWGDNEKRIN